MNKNKQSVFSKYKNEKKPYFLRKKNISSLSSLLYDMTLQRTIGNQEVKKMFESGMVRARLYVSDPGDTYEKEADKIAEQVVSMGEGIVTENKKRQGIQKKDSAGESTGVSDHIESGIKASQGHGQPMQKHIRDYYEPRFGIDLGNVHLHTDSNSDMLAKAINARAFTLGNDVFFAKGEYNPGTHEGKKLLAHELTHVLQQGGGIYHDYNVIKRVQDEKESALDKNIRKYENSNIRFIRPLDNKYICIGTTQSSTIGITPKYIKQFKMGKGVKVPYVSLSDLTKDSFDFNLGTEDKDELVGGRPKRTHYKVCRIDVEQKHTRDYRPHEPEYIRLRMHIEDKAFGNIRWPVSVKLNKNILNRAFDIWCESNQAGYPILVVIPEKDWVFMEEIYQQFDKEEWKKCLKNKKPTPEWQNKLDKIQTGRK